MLAIFLTTLISIFQPFKLSHYNKINVAFLNVLTLFCVSIIAAYSTQYLAPNFVTFFYILAALLASVPLLYTSIIIVHWVYASSRYRFVILRDLRKLKNGNRLTNLNESLPDRLNNSGEYPRQNLAYVAMNSVNG